MTTATSEPAAVLAEAARQARQGRYDAARRLLDQLGGRDSDDLEVLDLLARVHAQLGDLAAADACWARVEEIDRGHAGAREGRRRVAATWAGRHRSGARRAGSVVLVVLLVAAGVVVGSVLTPSDQAADSTVLAELRRSRAQQQELRDDLGALRSDVDRAVVQPRRTLESAREELAGPGRTVRLDEETVVVMFRTQLFTGAADLSPRGRRVLADAAGKLPDVDGDVAVSVVGHTDDVPVPAGSTYADNVELGLARAAAAARVVSRAADVPLGSVAVASGGPAGAPYPNTTAENRRKNRTVTLVVRPA